MGGKVRFEGLPDAFQKIWKPAETKGNEQQAADIMKLYDEPREDAKQKAAEKKDGRGSRKRKRVCGHGCG